MAIRRALPGISMNHHPAAAAGDNNSYAAGAPGASGMPMDAGPAGAPHVPVGAMAALAAHQTAPHGPHMGGGAMAPSRTLHPPHIPNAGGGPMRRPFGR